MLLPAPACVMAAPLWLRCVDAGVHAALALLALQLPSSPASGARALWSVCALLLAAYMLLAPRVSLVARCQALAALSCSRYASALLSPAFRADGCQDRLLTMPPAQLFVAAALVEGFKVATTFLATYGCREELEGLLDYQLLLSVVTSLSCCGASLFVCGHAALPPQYWIAASAGSAAPGLLGCGAVRLLPALLAVHTVSWPAQASGKQASGLAASGASDSGCATNSSSTNDMGARNECVPYRSTVRATSRSVVMKFHHAHLQQAPDLATPQWRADVSDRLQRRINTLLERAGKVPDSFKLAELFVGAGCIAVQATMVGDAEGIEANVESEVMTQLLESLRLEGLCPQRGDAALVHARGGADGSGLTSLTYNDNVGAFELASGTAAHLSPGCELLEVRTPLLVVPSRGRRVSVEVTLPQAHMYAKEGCELTVSLCPADVAAPPVPLLRASVAQLHADALAAGLPRGTMVLDLDLGRCPSHGGLLLQLTTGECLLGTRLLPLLPSTTAAAVKELQSVGIDVATAADVAFDLGILLNGSVLGVACDHAMQLECAEGLQAVRAAPEH
uniref:Uncharacterized protein n=1 Tax=Chlamydomonas euryale TaxID=1486919 RepID=A0A7R9V8G4_9CHLO|mmetsp:Transcript_2582/g.6919  ORF Transcript_2582/g.6919 Transcript_2582/m.6919 type:complete len:564 (+) Transcript_2582:2367-4058(+)